MMQTKASSVSLNSNKLPDLEEHNGLTWLMELREGRPWGLWTLGPRSFSSLSAAGRLGK